MEHKYIDSEKLIKKLKQQKNILAQSIQSQGDYGQSCQIVAINNIFPIITSLQQEQPKVDLEKEVRRWKNKYGVAGMDDLWLNFAIYIYELGFNARKK